MQDLTMFLLGSTTMGMTIFMVLYFRTVRIIENSKKESKKKDDKD